MAKEDNMDRRVRKTRTLLRKCLTELLKKKKIQDITVREISDLADINRGTFYLHYKDVFDLMEQVETELLDELNELINKYGPGAFLNKPSGIFTEVFTLVKNNADIVAILIGENGDLNFVNRLNGIVREKCLKDFMELFRNGNPESFNAYYSFIVSGCIGIVQYWLAAGVKETPEQLAFMTEQIMVKGIRVFEG